MFSRPNFRSWYLRLLLMPLYMHLKFVPLRPATALFLPSTTSGQLLSPKVTFLPRCFHKISSIRLALRWMKRNVRLFLPRIGLLIAHTFVPCRVLLVNLLVVPLEAPLVVLDACSRFALQDLVFRSRSILLSLDQRLQTPPNLSRRHSQAHPLYVNLRVVPLQKDRHC